VVTDVIRQPLFDDVVRGWAMIFFFGTTFVAVYLLIDNRRLRFAVFSIGLAVGGIAEAHFSPTGKFGNLPLAISWRYGIGQSVCLLALGLPFILRSSPVWRVYGLWVSFVLAPIHLLLNGRSLFGIVMTSGGATLFARFFKQRRLSSATIALIVVATALFGWSAATAYQYAVTSGFLGNEALQKYESQTSSDLGILFASRSEFLAAIPAIADSPLIGHGSWGRDWSYVLQRVAALQYAGYRFDVNAALGNDLIPSHSHILGAWVQAGILGALFWSWILILAVRAISRMLLSPNSLPLAAYMLFSLIWDVLFSPFGADQRFIVPAYICCAILLLHRRI
jgi:O-antigen ligase